ncbi:MAG TPA: NAD(P)H-dependent oxidoreductase subunit E, partial [Lachnospiraceae bacterium]|nr:NAD(P)H-dependent oxidoreductase subunit E [Lachnospiraceae bacterium]
MIVTICIGSSCHLKGSREIVNQMEELIERNKIGNKVSLCGSFCMGECVNGVCVKVDDELFSLSPNDTEQFFEEKILK